jgi:glycosyltransferase involved in cell wall biosynthesis
MKVAVVTNLTAPYRTELFRHVQPLLTDLCVLFQADFEPLRTWTSRPDLPYRHDYLRSRVLKLGTRRIGLFSGLGARLAAEPWDCIVSYGFSTASLTCARFAQGEQIPFLIANDGTLETDPKAGPEYYYRRAMVRMASAFVAASRGAAEYFQFLGAPEERIRVVPLTVDLSSIRDYVVDESQMRQMRERIGGGGRIVVFPTRLVEGKQVIDACEAVHGAASRAGETRLVIAGDGPLRRDVEAWSARHKSNRIILLGMIPWDEMMALYRLADIVLFPTKREKFGMVVIEALACGVPVIAYNRGGAARELIRDGINGYLVNEGDVAGLSQRIERVMADSALLAALRKEAVKVVDEHDVRVEARRFVDALRLATDMNQAKHRHAFA